MNVDPVWLRQLLFDLSPEEILGKAKDRFQLQRRDKMFREENAEVGSKLGSIVHVFLKRAALVTQILDKLPDCETKLMHVWCHFFYVDASQIFFKATVLIDNFSQFRAQQD